MQILYPRISLCCLFLVITLSLSAQTDATKGFFHPADTFHKGRFWTGVGIGSSVYTASMIGLSQIWYADFERTSFQFFNDQGEWLNMDKIGHLYSAYFESYLAYRGFRWAGCRRDRSIWGGIIVGSALQASIEVLDGFSEKWGFSIPDIAYNTAGVGLFAAQEWLWQEQRIIVKVSSSPVNYPDAFATSSNGTLYSLQERADELYGSYPAAFFKDYNAMTLWASVDIGAFLPKRKGFPRWLSLALGYSAHNLYGGFENSWEADGETFSLNPAIYPRYAQFYLSPDINWNRIPTRSPGLKVIFSLLNLLKFPAPALEFNKEQGFRLHPLRF
ncbi:MAG: DUF2279 domain-containing protein [Bacteroidota bacterium]